MLTATLFDNIGKTLQASTIRRHGEAWLRRHRVMVQSWADDCGVDISTEMSTDLHTYVPLPPDSPISVDVIVPFCAADSCYLVECLESLAAQRHVAVTAHVVADGCEFPDLSNLKSHISNLLRYSTSGGIGPYVIANAIVDAGHCQSDWIAIQDADDTSHPDRLWRHIQTMLALRADMISSAMENFVASEFASDSDLIRAARSEPIIRPGVTYSSVPLGRCINSLRTMRREFFKSLNGFCNLICSADFDFDNRARYTGAVVIDDQEILGRRRLHCGSLTNGSHRIGGDKRQAANAVVAANLASIQQTPTVTNACRMGDLDGSGDRSCFLRP